MPCKEDELRNINVRIINLRKSKKQSKLKEYEHQIDQLVYKLYGLSDEETRLIEGNS